MGLNSWGPLKETSTIELGCTAWSLGNPRQIPYTTSAWWGTNRPRLSECCLIAHLSFSFWRKIEDDKDYTADTIKTWKDNFWDYFDTIQSTIHWIFNGWFLNVYFCHYTKYIYVSNNILMLNNKMFHHFV